MIFKADIGIIGALEDEVKGLVGELKEHECVKLSGIDFHYGKIYGKSVVVARCGVGKVFAALCAEAMILSFAPDLLVNSGVGGALDPSLRPLDVVIADATVQQDMDTSPLGDPVGLISGINKIVFPCDLEAVNTLSWAAEALHLNYLVGTVATGDKFICDRADKERIVTLFGAVACEMEGGAINHVAYVNSTPCVVIRAISDSADGDAAMDYPTFLPKAVKNSFALTMKLIKEWNV